MPEAQNDRINADDAAGILDLPTTALEQMNVLETGPVPEYDSDGRATYSHSEAQRYRRYAEMLRFGDIMQADVAPQGTRYVH